MYSIRDCSSSVSLISHVSCVYTCSLSLRYSASWRTFSRLLFQQSLYAVSSCFPALQRMRTETRLCNRICPWGASASHRATCVPESKGPISSQTNHPTSTPSSPSRTSSPTPPCSSTIFTIRAIVALFTPPRLGLQTPGTSSSPVEGLTIADSSAAAVEFTVATFSEFGIPGCVSRDGGSIVRIESSFSRPESVSWVIEIASTASATAISSRLGSKMLFSATEMTSRVTGGLTLCVGIEPGIELFVDLIRGYKYSAASQSSSKNGSSSPFDFSFGSFVARSAR